MFESNTITVVIDPEIDNQGVIAKAVAVAVAILLLLLLLERFKLLP